ncbi:Segregation and condensation protein B [Varanus komodoensis]|nr:Segregation and condensation protein B [Varanus komodoensis]
MCKGTLLKESRGPLVSRLGSEEERLIFQPSFLQGPPGRRPSRRGRRRKSSGARPSARPEATRIRGPSADPGPSPLVDYSIARRPRPGRPVKNRRRKLPT